MEIRCKYFWSNSWDYQLYGRTLNVLPASCSYFPYCLKKCYSIQGFMCVCCGVVSLSTCLHDPFALRVYLYFCHQSTLTSGCTLTHLAFLKLLPPCFVWSDSLFLIWSFFECYSWFSQCYSSTSQMEPGVMGSWLLSVPLKWSQCPVPFSLSLVSLTLCQKCWLKSALWILMLICDATWFFYMFAQLTESSSTVFPAEMRYLGIK